MIGAVCVVEMLVVRPLVVPTREGRVLLSGSFRSGVFAEQQQTFVGVVDLGPGKPLPAEEGFQRPDRFRDGQPGLGPPPIRAARGAYTRKETTRISPVRDTGRVSRPTA